MQERAWTKGKRYSNFEILRVVAIGMIVAFHYVFKGGFIFENEVSLNRFIFDVVYYMGEWGVNVFILISGYFLPNTVRKWNKVVSIILQCYFYTILCKWILVYYTEATWAQWGYKDYLFPILVPKYWFVTAYVLIYLLSPYLHVMVTNLSKRQYQEILILWFVIWSVFPTVITGYIYGGVDLEQAQNYNRFIWLLGMYLCGGYIRLHGVPHVLDSMKRRLGFLGIVLTVLVVHILLAEHGLSLAGKSPQFLWQPNTIMQVALSISLFLVFEAMDIGFHPLINKLAGCTLGIYMLHDGELWDFLWQRVFRNATHQYSRFFIIHILIAVVSLMAVGVAIELMRKWLEKAVVRIITRIKKEKSL